VPARQPPGTQCQHPRLGGVDVVDHDVEMDLLRPAWVGPPRRLEIGRQLEPDARGFVISGDDGKVVLLPGDWQAEELGVEPRKRNRVGAVHDHVVKASDHGSILPRRNGAAQPGVLAGIGRSAAVGPPAAVQHHRVVGQRGPGVVEHGGGLPEVGPPRPPPPGIGLQPLREPRPAPVTLPGD